LIETGIWLVPLPCGCGGDGAWNAGDGAGDRTTSNDMARDVLYMLKNFDSNSRDVEYSPSVDRDGYPQWQAARTGGDVADGAVDHGAGTGD
jgi:hypothetical protein